MRLIALLAGVVAFGAWAETPLEKAERLFNGLDYPQAQRALEQAEKQPENDRATTLRIYELQAIVAASLGQGDKAVKMFKQLLVLSPEYALPGNQPPRVKTPWYEARGWLAEKKPLELKALEPELAGGKIFRLRVQVVNDPLKLVKKVRFFLLREGRVSAVDVAADAKELGVLAGAPQVSWWAHALGPYDATVLELFSEKSPRVDGKTEELKQPAPLAELTPAPAPAAAPVASAEPLIEQTPSRPMSGKRLASFGLVAAAAVSFGVGLALGISASGLRARVDNAPRDGSGLTVGLTQREALELDAAQRTQAAVANVLFVGAGVLAAAGVTLFVLSLGDDGQVAVLPAANGLVFSGSF